MKEYIVETNQKSEKLFCKLHKITKVEAHHGETNTFGNTHDINFKIFVNDGKTQFDNIVNYTASKFLNDDDTINHSKLFKIEDLFSAAGLQLKLTYADNKWGIKNLDELVGKELYFIVYASGNRKAYVKDGLSIQPVNYKIWDRVNKYNDREYLLKLFQKELDKGGKYAPVYTPDAEPIKTPVENVGKDEFIQENPNDPVPF